MSDTKWLMLSLATLAVWVAWAAVILKIGWIAINGPLILLVPDYLLSLWLTWTLTEGWSLHRYFDGGDHL